MATILVVDDSAVDRRMAGGLLEKNLDYAVRYAENGLAAMTAIGEIHRGDADVLLRALEGRAVERRVHRLGGDPLGEHHPGPGLLAQVLDPCR